MDILLGYNLDLVILVIITILYYSSLSHTSMYHLKRIRIQTSEIHVPKVCPAKLVTAWQRYINEFVLKFAGNRFSFLDSVLIVFNYLDCVLVRQRCVFSWLNNYIYNKLGTEHCIVKLPETNSNCTHSAGKAISSIVWTLSQMLHPRQFHNHGWL